jgi:hypothetical protein
MIFTRRQKQALVAMTNPLRDAGILQRVFTFLPGHWLFLGAVCREWQDSYADMGEQHISSFNSLVYNKPVPCGTKTTLYSAAVASPATARLASSCGLAVDKKTLQIAAGLLGDMQTLAALRELGMPLSDTVVRAAALSGRLHMLQHLLAQQGCPRPKTIGLNAAGSGSISMLKWLRLQSWCKFDHETCAGAALGGQLLALQHLRSVGCDWDVESIARCPARSGKVEVVKWLRQQQGIVINATVMAAAAAGGQIAMCEHLRSAGCEWDSSACVQAVVSGEIQTLRWLQEHGCPWDVIKVFITAASRGFTDILDYIMQQGEVLDAELLTHALNCAGAYKQLQAARWLRQHGALWPAVLLYGQAPRIKQWSGDTLAWARAEGCISPIAL